MRCAACSLDMRAGFNYQGADMEYRKLAGTDLDVSRVVLGTMTFGSQVDSRVAEQMVGLSIESGVNMIDTANAYNNGDSERMLAGAIRGRRDEVLVATKVFNPMGDDSEDKGLSRPAINKAIDASLERLETDYIDLYYLHQPDHEVPLEESLGAMNELVGAGKVRYIGLSNFAAWQHVEALWLSERNAWQMPRVSQPLLNLLSRRIEEEYAACSKQFGLSNIVYNPLAGGLLTGKHRRESTPEEGTRFSMSMYRDRYWNEEQFKAVDRFHQIAVDEGLSLIELSYGWLLAHPLTDHVLLGASSMEHLESNLAACDGTSPRAHTLERCDEVWQVLRGVAPAYNR
ncbi:MAG: aldo/keto reductase [Actinomycetota bacterium]|nr:aldo/keto reductase [Actinomycetota bacterium]